MWCSHLLSKVHLATASEDQIAFSLASLVILMIAASDAMSFTTGVLRACRDKLQTRPVGSEKAFQRKLQTWPVGSERELETRLKGRKEVQIFQIFRELSDSVRICGTMLMWYHSSCLAKCSKSRDLVRLRFAIRIANRKSLAIWRARRCDSAAIWKRLQITNRAIWTAIWSVFDSDLGDILAIWAPRFEITSDLRFVIWST